MSSKREPLNNPLGSFVDVTKACLILSNRSNFRYLVLSPTLIDSMKILMGKGLEAISV